MDQPPPVRGGGLNNKLMFCPTPQEAASPHAALTGKQSGVATALFAQGSLNGRTFTNMVFVDQVVVYMRHQSRVESTDPDQGGTCATPLGTQKPGGAQEGARILSQVRICIGSSWGVAPVSHW